MAGITSIDPIERLEERDADIAIAELRQSISDFGLHLEELAQAYPGCIGIGACVCGRVRGILVLAGSREGLHCSPIAPDRMRVLARIVGSFPAELRFQFEAELANIPVVAGQVDYVVPENDHNLGDNAG